MARGFLSGVIWGGLVSVTGLGVTSVLMGPVTPVSQEAAPEASHDAQTVAPEVGTAETESTDAAVMADADPAPADMDDATPEAEAPEPDVTPVTEDAPQEAAPESDQEAMPEAVQELDPAQDVTPEATPDVAGETPVELPQVDAEGEAPQEAAPEVAPVEEAPAPVEPEQEAPAAPQAPAEAPADEPAAEPADDNGPSIGTPVAPIGNQVEGVTTNRLPSITQPDESAQTPATPNVDPAQAQSPLAIERNAVAFTNPEGRPMVAIMLLDEGLIRSQLEGLDKLPFPVTVVVEATAVDAQAAIDFYKAAGVEVMVEATLPPQPTAIDVEVNLQVQAPIMEQASAIYMDPETGIQTDAQLAAQIADILVTTGHGLVTEPSGLNTGHKTAVKAGLPAAVVFRDLDGEGQDGRVIRRFVDNAAFKAGQENGVILMGRAVPETVQALVEWSLGNRAKSVALAPVSAMLLSGS